ncbi:hypothetical protein P7C71_g6585, partial [Lecanoromycetidae sp. Uapishka_2]
MSTPHNWRQNMSRSDKTLDQAMHSVAAKRKKRQNARERRDEREESAEIRSGVEASMPSNEDEEKTAAGGANAAGNPGRGHLNEAGGIQKTGNSRSQQNTSGGFGRRGNEKNAGRGGRDGGCGGRGGGKRGGWQPSSEKPKNGRICVVCGAGDAENKAYATEYWVNQH